MNETVPEKELGLVDFQERQCRGCRYAAPEKVGTGEPCCTYAFGVNIVAGICLTRKDQPAKGKRK